MPSTFTSNMVDFIKTNFKRNAKKLGFLYDTKWRRNKTSMNYVLVIILIFMADFIKTNFERDAKN